MDISKLRKQLRFHKGGINIEIPIKALSKVINHEDKEGKQRLKNILDFKEITTGDWEYFTGYYKDPLDWYPWVN